SFRRGRKGSRSVPRSARQEQNANKHQDVDRDKNETRLAKSRSHFRITSLGALASDTIISLLRYCGPPGLSFAAGSVVVPASLNCGDETRSRCRDAAGGGAAFDSSLARSTTGD